MEIDLIQKRGTTISDLSMYFTPHIYAKITQKTGKSWNKIA